MPSEHCLSGLKSMRLSKSVAPLDLARTIGVNLNSYYRYERGAARIQFDRVCRLADMLGCTTDDLRWDRTVPEPKPAQWGVVE